MTFTWEQSRRLAIIVKGSNNISYKYNDEGLRVSKTVNGVTHTYLYDGSLLVSEEYVNIVLLYIHDANGSPIGFKYRTTSYKVKKLHIHL